MSLDDFPHKMCAVNEHVFILRVNENLLTQFYIYLFLQRPETYKKLNTIASSKAAQPGLNQEQFGDEFILVPHKNILNKFNNIVTPLMKKIACGSKQSLQYQSLSEFLLPLLMNGQVKIKTDK